MKILYLWDADYPWDIRVEKVCNSLIARGHEVHLVCRNLKRNVRHEYYQGIHIHRLSYLPKLFGRLNYLFSFPAFFSPLWLWEIFRQVRKYQCKVILVRDLPMAPAAVLVGKLLGVQTVLDMAECYPEILRAIWKFERFKLSNIFVRNPYLADIVEHVTLRLIDRIIVMIEESRDRLTTKGISDNKIYIVSNTPELKRIKTDLIQTNKRAVIQREPLRMVYVGLLNPSRGLDTTIEAVSQYIKHNRNFEFVVIGSGKALSQLQSVVHSGGLEKFVHLRGWLENQEAAKQIESADIGIVPHHWCSHWNTTIPNKLFDYMAAGKPVVVSNVRPMARIVNEVGCGVVYDDKNTSSLVEALTVLEDPATRLRLGNRGRDAVRDRYNWTIEEKILMKAIEAGN